MQTAMRQFSLIQVRPASRRTRAAAGPRSAAPVPAATALRCRAAPTAPGPAAPAESGAEPSNFAAGAKRQPAASSLASSMVAPVLALAIAVSLAAIAVTYEPFGPTGTAVAATAESVGVAGWMMAAVAVPPAPDGPAAP